MARDKKDLILSFCQRRGIIPDCLNMKAADKSRLVIIL